MSTNPEINKVFGGRVKEMRCKNGLTREQLAEKIEVSSRLLANVESGKVNISLPALKSICKVLGATSDYLLGIVDYSEAERSYIDIENRIKQANTRYLPHLKGIIDISRNAAEGDYTQA